MRAVLAGFGFLGSRIAEALTAAGFAVTVVRRSLPSPTLGIEFVRCDLMRAPPAFDKGDFDLAVFCLAPGARDATLYRQTYCDAQTNFLAGVKAANYIYVSSTAVYPEKSGTYREDAGSKHTARAEILLEAEAIAQARNACVLRLAGLYHSDRPIYGGAHAAYTEDKLVHFIHRDDAAAAVLHAAKQNLHGVFNVHDGNPQWRSAILQRLGLNAPELAQTEKRLISAEKFFATGFKPRYSDYFAGVGLKPLNS